MADLTDLTIAYGKALLEIGQENQNVVVLDADLADSCQTEPFYKAFPGRAFDLGVAEQSLPTFAVGLSLVGKIPFTNTFAVFAVNRGLDQIRMAAYMRANIKLVGHASGHSLGYAGPSHHCLEDISVLRSIANMVILSPCDAEETRQMVHWMAKYDGPVYMRLIRTPMPSILPSSHQFSMGKVVEIKEGDALTIFTTGDMVLLALRVHDQLAAEGKYCSVVHVPTLKPLAAEEITGHGKATRGAITIEDHNLMGGLGSIISEIYAEHLQKPVKRVGIPDCFTESDDRDILLNAYQVNFETVLAQVRSILK